MFKVIVIAAIGLLLVLGLSGFAWFGGPKAVARESRGPFAIETLIKRISAGGFPNTSGNPFERTEVTEFRLLHRGKPIAVTVSGGTIDRFWEARFLEDAPRPAVLLAGTGLWLVTEENGAAKVDELKEQDTSGALMQWLDGADGQPAKPVHVGIRDARGESRSYKGGTLLLLGRGAVLDVRTLAIQRYRPYQADGFSASNDDARRLSPGRSQYVLLGHKSNRDDNTTAYALVVADPGRQLAYAVPFDRKATRLVDANAIDATWFDHHFAWGRDDSGAEKLVRRTGAPPYPRLGRIVQFGSVMAQYHLDEATPPLQQALLAFLVERFDARVLPSRTADVPDTSGTLIWLRMGAQAYKLRFDPKDREVLLSFPSVRLDEEADAYARLKEAAQAFNAVLATGQHRDLFDDAPAK
ncbi:MAG: hypothetical protein IPH37_02855 [Burkholderiales bacterium]|nr:hypothetical protein [Burkholderiales bacterium]